jgi:hypothetical protein
MKKLNSAIGVAGFFRLKLIDHGKNGTKKVVGDSGWCKNLVTNLGFSQYILGPTIGGGTAITGAGNGWMALGTGAAPSAADTALAGECSFARFTMTTPTIVSSKTIQYLGTFASGVAGATAAIANVGIFNVSTVSGGTLLCGNTYAASTLQTNQSVNVTYQLRFATA